MSWDDAAKVAVAVLTVAAAAMQVARAREGGRAGIKHDLEILKLLAPSSRAHRALSEHVESRVIAMVDADRNARRDWNGLTAAVFCLAVAVLLGAFGFAGGGLLGYAVLVPVAALFLLIAIYGAAVSIPRRKRDAKGNPIKNPPTGG